MGIWRTFPNRVTTEVDASLFMPLRPSSLGDERPLNTLPKESVDAIVRSTERIEGAASILAMLEEKADGGRVTPSEIAAVRCVLESCAAELDEAWSLA